MFSSLSSQGTLFGTLPVADTEEGVFHALHHHQTLSSNELGGEAEAIWALCLLGGHQHGGGLHRHQLAQSGTFPLSLLLLSASYTYAHTQTQTSTPTHMRTHTHRHRVHMHCHTRPMYTYMHAYLCAYPHCPSTQHI